jgi:DNA-binding PucR family transcriptional regulator
VVAGGGGGQQHEGVAGATLGDLVDNLHAGIVQLLAAPAGLDVEVGEVVIFDPVEPEELHLGDVVLGVGVAAAERDAAALVERAAAAGAAAVVFRTSTATDTTSVAARATAVGVAVLAVPLEMTWAQLHSLLRTARATVSAEDDRPPSSTPVGDLFSLANAVAASVGGPVTIEDPHSTVLAYSSLDEPIDEPRRQTILGRRVPEQWIRRLRDEGVFKRLWSEPDVVEVDFSETDPGLRPRLAMAVRAGDEILGSIWVAEGDRPFGREAADALREAAQIAALHLIRHRASEDLDRRRRSDQLRAVLDGRLPTEVLAGTLGLPSTALVTVVIFSIGEAGPDRPARTVLAERAAGIIALHCEAFRRHAATVPLGASVYVLLSHNEGLERAALLPFVSSVADRSAEALGARVTAAVGSTVSLTDVSASRLEADQTLRALHAEGRGRSVATIDDVRSTAVLLELREHATRQPAILEGKAHLLAEHDAARGTDYVATLRAYLDAFGDVPRAAAAVAVHPNTFRYRLRRLAELADLDLTDPTERLVVSLQLAIEHPGP